jgi:broad specificity phosphatase PhoE
MKKILGIISLILLVQVLFAQDEQSTQLFFIRHAEKVKSGDDPALTKIGAKRAIYWAQVFKNIDFAAVYSTQTKRTISTALPSAEQSDVSISIYDTKTVDIKEIAEKHKGKSILIVGHSNTIPGLVNSLIDKEEFPEIESANNSNLYIVNYGEGNPTVSLLYIQMKVK